MSIDALRGFDMLMIIFADRFFFSLNSAVDSPLTQSLAKQFRIPTGSDRIFMTLSCRCSCSLSEQLFRIHYPGRCRKIPHTINL